MNLFVVSDTHFGHENIISYCNRPFADAQEMDEAMISRWNAVVKPSDHVYHLGDVAMRRDRLKAVMPRLAGHLRLVRGNHDIFKTKDYLEFFDEIYGIRVIDNLLMTHIPVHPDSLGRFSANIHGHVHTSRALTLPWVNVCVEVTDYRPIALEDLKREIARGS